MGTSDGDLTNLVARGLEEICGRERNSSRSMVPEASCGCHVRTSRVYILKQTPAHLIKLHETFPQTIHFISVNYPHALAPVSDPIMHTP